MGASGSASPAVVVDGVSKTFAIPHELTLTLKERALHPFRRTGHDRFEALNDVTFSVPRGEFFGIVGRNGSGKSTLLKCMAGIYKVDGGRIVVDGRISPFIELGVGFNMDLAARENVYMNAIMLGLSPGEARRIFERVIDFAELEEFTELKLKNYSSGMLVRLAFSVMVHVPAEIMLIDEVLAVGDAAFQQKCFDAFSRMRDEGRTILLVTHDTHAVTRFCHRALLIERGDVLTIGEPEHVVNQYLEINFQRERAQSATDPSPEREGDGAVRLAEVWLEDGQGHRRATFVNDEVVRIRARVEVRQVIEDPILNAVVANDEHKVVFAVSSVTHAETTGSFAAGESFDVTIEFENALAPGRYALSMVIAHQGTGLDVMDRWERILTFMTTSSRATGGMVDLPHTLRIERAQEPVPGSVP